MKKRLNKKAFNKWAYYSIKVSMDITPESELIYQVQLKNAKAFSYLYNAYSPALFGYIKRMVKCRFTTEEILQNVFLKIWLNINMYASKKGSLYTWMLSIARHEAIDYKRSKETKKRGLTCPINETESRGATYTERRLLHFDILKSFSLLEHKERIIIELANLGFTCKGMGQFLSIPEGSVKTKMRNSYRKLRTILA